MPLKVFKRNKLYSYRGTVAGRRLRGPTGTADKRIAERIAAEIETKAWQSHLDGPGATLTFAQAAIAYRQAERDDQFLDRVEDYWKDTLVPKITGEAIRQMARKLYPGAANATLNRQGIVPAQAIINYAADLEWCARIRVKRFKVNAKRKTPATRGWVEAFAQQAAQDELHHLAALCLFMFGTGARRGEACALTWGDVELFQKKAVINQTKIDDQRVAHLSRHWRTFLRTANLTAWCFNMPPAKAWGRSGTMSLSERASKSFPPIVAATDLQLRCCRQE